MFLLVEDNESISKGLEYSFKQNKFALKIIDNVSETIVFLETNNPELIILDIALPDGNGLDLYEEYIKEKNIPTIFLTAIDEEETIVKGLNIGADDYLTKPFSTKELFARINKILRQRNKNTIIKVKDIKFDIDKMVVYKNDVPVELTSLELKILQILFLNVNRVVRRTFLIDKVYEWTGNDINDNTITVYLKRIREKLKTDIIITIKGIGYRIDEE